MEFALKNNFNAFCWDTSLALELRTIIGTINQPFDSFKRSEYGIPVYSNFSGAKYEECE